MDTRDRDEARVIAAFNDYEQAQHALAEARRNYRDLLRAYLAAGHRGAQARLSLRLSRTREMLRQDAMEDAQREAIRRKR